MEAVIYKPRQLGSVPMYDDVHKSFHVLIGEEMVEIPEDLFHKLYRESKPMDLSALYESDAADLSLEEVVEYFMETTRQAIQYGIPKETFLGWVEEGCDLYPEKVDDKQEVLDRCGRWYDQIKREEEKDL